VMGPAGLRSIGGTSIAAPNAAGAAAVLLAAARRAGGATSPDAVRGQLSALSLDLGAAGPDQVFGAGRVRVSVDAPRVAGLVPAPLQSVRGRVEIRFRALSRSRIARWALHLDGVPIVARSQREPRAVAVDTRRLPDGFHVLRGDARDWPGNTGSREWAVKIDNTRPVLIVRRVAVERASNAQSERAATARRAPPPRRRVHLLVAAADPGSTGVLSARIGVRTAKGVAVSARTVRVRQGSLRRLPLGRLRPGRYLVRVELRDRAGNVAGRTRKVLVRPPAGRPDGSPIA
jgi:hypothetical protein